LRAKTDDPESTGPPKKRVTKSTPTTGARRNFTPINATAAAAAAAATVTHRRGVLREYFKRRRKQNVWLEMIFSSSLFMVIIIFALLDVLGEAPPELTSESDAPPIGRN
jgi:hypothetical protein